MAGNRILVVEDDVAVRKIIQIALERDNMLRGWGLRVEHAVDGREGLALFKKEPPDLMIVDLLMPKMNGFDLVEAVRDNPAGKDLPIIVTSDVYRDEKTLQKLQEDFDVKVQMKPFDPKKLARLVFKLLRRANKLTPPGKPKPKIGRMGLTNGKGKKPPAKGKKPPAKGKKQPTKGEQGSAPVVKKPAAPAVPPAEVKRSGTLSETPLAQLLLEALEDRYTGHLSLSKDKVLKRIYMMVGYPVYVESNLRSETLGQMLVRRDVLTRDQHRQAMAASRDKNIKFGEALASLDIISGPEVLKLLTEQIRHKIEVCLDWHDGTWTYTEDHSLSSKVPHHTIDPVELVFKGLVRHVNLEVFLTRLSINAEQFRLELLPRGARLWHRFTGHHGEEVADAIVEGKAIGEVLQVADLRSVVEQIYTLLECGMVRQVRLKRPSVAVPINAGDMYELNNLADQVLNVVAQEVEDVLRELAPARGGDEELALAQTDEAQESTPDEASHATGQVEAPKLDEDDRPFLQLDTSDHLTLAPPQSGVVTPDGTDQQIWFGDLADEELNEDLQEKPDKVADQDQPPAEEEDAVVDRPAISAAEVLEQAPFDMNSVDLQIDASERLCITPLGARAVAPDDTEEIRAVDRDDASEARRLIGDTYLAMHSQSHYDLLDVSPDSELEVIEIAYQTKCKDFALQRFRNMDLGEDFGYLEEIHRRLDQAHSALSSANSRKEYDEDMFTGRETAEYESPFLAEQAYDAGEHLTSEGRHEEAAQAYSEAAEHDNQPEYRAMEAWAVFKAHDCAADVGEEMLDVVQESLGDAPGQYAIHMVAAWLHRALGHLDQSVQHYQAVIQLNPGLRKAFDELEDLLTEAGQLGLLEEQYRRTIFLLDDADPDYAANLWKRLTMLYAKKLEDRQKAQTAGNAVVKMKPEEAEELEEELEMEFELFPDDDDEEW